MNIEDLMEKTQETILDYIRNIQIIDTHEHLPSKEEQRDKNTDVLKEYLLHYFSRDLISSGMTLSDYQEILDGKISISEEWKIVEPYWKASRYTAYGRSLEIAARGIYGIDRIDESTIEQLNYKFTESLKPGHFKKVLKDMCKIKTSLLNVHVLNSSPEAIGPYCRSIDCDKNFFSPVYVINTLIYPLTFSQIELIGEESGIRITSFAKWLEATEVIINKALSLGSIGLKNGLAYLRPLKFDRVSIGDAEEGFNNVFKTKHIGDTLEDRPVNTSKAFQDYMFHFILDIANKRNLLVQIHTGMMEGSGNIISNSNPELLSNLFLQYPNIIFDIFHISYPYQNILAVIAKNFPNIYVDMCWAHLISPNASINYLLELLDTVPLNKIFAFGGDYMFVDGVYGHITLARENVAKALSIKVSEGLFGLDEAKHIAKMLFYDNPLKIFRLGSS